MIIKSIDLLLIDILRRHDPMAPVATILPRLVELHGCHSDVACAVLHEEFSSTLPIVIFSTSHRGRDDITNFRGLSAGFACEQLPHAIFDRDLRPPSQDTRGFAGV